MTSKLEIIDTAIKVGLGLLISGIAAYLLACRTHRHEIHKNLLSEKISLLRQCAISLEQAGSLINQTTDSIHLIRLSVAVDKETQFHETMGGFTAAFNCAREARSLCYIIDKKDLGELLNRYTDTIQELITYYGEQGLDYDVSHVNTITEKRKAIKDDILNSFGGVMNSIHRS